MQIHAFVPFIPLAALVLTLLLVPRLGIAKPAVIAALVALAMSPGDITAIISKVAPNLLGVLVVMTAVQLAVSMAMDERGGDWLGALIARPLQAAKLANVPASVLVPCILMPLAMAAAACIHNIPAVALLAPIAYSLCVRLGIPWVPSLVGLIPASNLGGASAAWGDTPAIVQRLIWGFDVSTFAVNMLPRNLVILAVLILVVALWTYLANRRAGTRHWHQVKDRKRVEDQIRGSRAPGGSWTRDQYLGGAGLVGLFAAQMLQPTHALGASMVILAVLLALRSSGDFVNNAFALGDEAVLAIAALFVMSAVIEHSPVLNDIAEALLTNRNGGVEMVAYVVTGLISADGAANMLAKVVHAKHDGSLDAAWALASGICAGSTALLTSASAGPVLIEAAKRSGAPMNFRTYAAFGVPFSIAMLAAYLLLGSFGVQ